MDNRHNFILRAPKRALFFAFSALPALLAAANVQSVETTELDLTPPRLSSNYESTSAVYTKAAREAREEENHAAKRPSTKPQSTRNAQADTTYAPLSFEAARNLYHKRSDLFRADDAEIARAAYMAEAAKSLSGPKVEFTAMQIEGTKTIDLNLGSLPVGQIIGGALAGTSLSQILQPSDLASLGKLNIPLALHDKMDIGGPRAVLSLNWPLYTGGAITAQQNALNHKVREAQAARDGRLETKDAELAAKYWQVQLVRSVERLRVEMLADEERSVERAKHFEKQGLISRIERMSTEVSRDAAKREVAVARTDTEVAEAELMNALREETLPPLESPLFILTGNLGTLSEWQDRALLQNPILAQIDAQKNQATEGVRAAKSAYSPTVFAFGMKNLIKHYLTLPEPDWMAGIGVRFTLWDNKDRASSVSAAESVRSKAEAAGAEARNAIRTAVETAFLRTTQARDEYELTASTVALARENLDLRTKSFEEGLSTAIDVSNARTQLVAAEIARRAAAYKFVVGWVMLHAASGAIPDFVASLSRNDLVPVE